MPQGYELLPIQVIPLEKAGRKDRPAFCVHGIEPLLVSFFKGDERCLVARDVLRRREKVIFNPRRTFLRGLTFGQLIGSAACLISSLRPRDGGQSQGVLKGSYHWTCLDHRKIDNLLNCILSAPVRGAELSCLPSSGIPRYRAARGG